MSAAGHLDHLTDSDLVLLAELGGARGAAVELRPHPEHVVTLLADPRVYDALLRPPPGREPLTGTSAFLVFACLVERAACELRSTSSVAEPVAGRKVPLFDAQELREFV